MRYLIARSQSNRFSQLSFRIIPIAIVMKTDEAKRGMSLSQIGISFNGLQRSLFCQLPRLGRRRLHIPVQEGIAVGQLRVGKRKSGVELDCTFKPFNGLTQALSRTTGRIVATRGVELARLFVFTW